MDKKKIVPYAVIGISGVYFISIIASVGGLLITGSSVLGAVILLEVSTILSAPAILLLLETMPFDLPGERNTAKKLSVLFMACCMVLTSAVHFVQLTLTQPLIASGVRVPDYLQVGFWPSVPMAVDYLAWGFFMGTAFLCSFFAAGKSGREKWQGMNMMKNTLLVCGLLSYAGLAGVVFINENCWYIAPMGYGVGTVVVCIELICQNKCR